jgi:hypothetical protein
MLETIKVALDDAVPQVGLRILTIVILPIFGALAVGYVYHEISALGDGNARIFVVRTLMAFLIVLVAWTALGFTAAIPAWKRETAQARMTALRAASVDRVFRTVSQTLEEMWFYSDNRLKFDDYTFGGFKNMLDFESRWLGSKISGDLYRLIDRLQGRYDHPIPNRETARQLISEARISIYRYLAKDGVEE